MKVGGSDVWKLRLRLRIQREGATRDQEPEEVGAWRWGREGKSEMGAGRK
jgi:hypothetical protein